MRLVVVHNHFRPGGVRRVIELATPFLARSLRPQVHEVVLATGESPETTWLLRFERSLAPFPVRCCTERSFGYLAQQHWERTRTACRIRSRLEELFTDAETSGCLVWAHNQGLGRNLILTHQLLRSCGDRNIPLVLHHHDWWFDNRWQRWPEMRRAGFRTVAAVARAILGTGPQVYHAAINQADAKILRKHFPGHGAWIPNPAEPRKAPTARSPRRNQSRLSALLGANDPVWLMPCRLLRRKNIAEGLLITRWLRPDAWLVTTAGVSSAEERPYADRLARAAAEGGWRLRLGLLEGCESGKPSVGDLLAESEAVLLTSLQEGFGLPFLEAAAAERPLIARALPNVLPDLTRLGLRFPQCYEELLVHPALFDWGAETARQRRMFGQWRRNLPGPCRRLIQKPWLLQKAVPRPIPFSRLTLTAQLEVLKAPTEKSWELCAPLNRFLGIWRRKAQRGDLRATQWPPQAEARLGGAAYAARFNQIISAAPSNVRPGAAAAAQAEFVRQKVASGNLYPLTWSPNV